jgi:hypothetical protein
MEKVSPPGFKQKYETLYNDHPDENGNYTDEVLELVTSGRAVMIVTDICTENAKGKYGPSHRMYEYFIGGAPYYAIKYNYVGVGSNLEAFVYNDDHERITVYQGGLYKDAKQACREYLESI